MQLKCGKCRGIAKLKSRPNEDFGENTVYHRNYAVCETCGSTLSIESISKVIFTPPDWIPRRAPPLQPEQVALKLVDLVD